MSCVAYATRGTQLRDLKGGGRRREELAFPIKVDPDDDDFFIRHQRCQ
jgi:hypothetical protein